MELEALHGLVVRRAAELGVPVPMSEAVYAILKPWAIRNERPGSEPMLSTRFRVGDDRDHLAAAPDLLAELQRTAREQKVTMSGGSPSGRPGHSLGHSPCVTRQVRNALNGRPR